MAISAPTQSGTDLQQSLLSAILKRRGEPYVWGQRDCSTTTCQVYKEATGLDLVKGTASDQYLRLANEGQLASPARDASGKVDSQALAREMKPGDLIFFSNTYKPDRSRGSDVTHVMVYLGQNEKGEMLMGGAQKSHGVNAYVFDPNKSVGGYSTADGRVKGEFCGFGRPTGGMSTELAQNDPSHRISIQPPTLKGRSPVTGAGPSVDDTDAWPQVADNVEMKEIAAFVAILASLLAGPKETNPWQGATHSTGRNFEVSNSPQITHA